jgi:hypothetical protein
MSALLDNVGLAERWQTTPVNAQRKAKKLGLRGFKPGKKLLYPVERVVEVERRETAAPENQIAA